MPSKISQEAINLIIEFEVSSKEYYEKAYQRPEWPGVNSGVTVGIGYDLGYNSAADIRSDWAGVLPTKTIEAMVKYAGLTKGSAKSVLPQAKREIIVPWDAAYKVFSERTLPKWIKTVESKLPNTDMLTPTCLGVLVSMAYNMGPAFDNPADKYREMRNIKVHMANLAFGKIPDEIRSTKRNWPGVKGLLRRRDAEAALFEKGLVAIVPEPAKEEPETTNYNVDWMWGWFWPKNKD